MKKLYLLSATVLILSLVLGIIFSLRKHTEMTAGVTSRETAFTNSVAEIEKLPATSPTDEEIKTKGLAKLAAAKEAAISKAKGDWAIESLLLMFAIPLSLGGITFFMGYRSLVNGRTSLAY